MDFFRLCPPPLRYAPPVTEDVPLHSESLCKNMARASGGANDKHPLILGHKRKRSNKYNKLNNMFIVHMIKFRVHNGVFDGNVLIEQESLYKFNTETRKLKSELMKRRRVDESNAQVYNQQQDRVERLPFKER